MRLGFCCGLRANDYHLMGKARDLRSATVESSGTLLKTNGWPNDTIVFAWKKGLQTDRPCSLDNRKPIP
jgi:hypothetical protein